MEQSYESSENLFYAFSRENVVLLEVFCTFRSKEQDSGIISVIWVQTYSQRADKVNLFYRFDRKSNIFDIPRPVM